MKFLVCLRRWRRSRTIRWHKACIYTDGNCESCVAPRKAAINDVGRGGGSSLARTQGLTSPSHRPLLRQMRSGTMPDTTQALVWRCPKGRSGKHGGRRLLFHPKYFRAERDDETQLVIAMSPTLGVIVALFAPFDIIS